MKRVSPKCSRDVSDCSWIRVSECLLSGYYGSRAPDGPADPERNEARCLLSRSRQGPGLLGRMGRMMYVLRGVPAV